LDVDLDRGQRAALPDRRGGFAERMRLANRFRLWLVASLISAAAGAGYVAILSAVENEEIAPLALLRGAVYGTIIGGGVIAFHLYFVQAEAGAWLRRLSFPVSLVFRLVAAMLIMGVGLWLGYLLFQPPFSWRWDWFGRDLAFSFAVMLALIFVIQVRRLVGGRVLGNFVFGRYHRPVREERVFLFLDLADSTALSQRLGDVGVHSLISRVFFDIDAVIVGHGGEVHRYIGDEVVASWPLADCRHDGRCLACVLAIFDLIAARADGYRRRFGVVPAFRGGMHGGMVVAGQCGDSKQEIVYFGDTINTAARIGGECKRLDVPLLISSELLAALPLPQGVRAVSNGSVQLRGRDRETELFTLVQEGA
jgi:adenylate cyclase